MEQTVYKPEYVKMLQNYRMNIIHTMRTLNAKKKIIMGEDDYTSEWQKTANSYLEEIEDFLNQKVLIGPTEGELFTLMEHLEEELGDFNNLVLMGSKSNEN